MYFKNFIILFFLINFTFSGLSGTIFLKNGKSISDVEIVSISDGKIVIEKDKSKHIISASKLKSYYNSDIESAGGSADIRDLPDYDISVDIEMPGTGNTGKLRFDNDNENCEINFRIRRAERSSSKPKKVKQPYFYLFVLSNEKEKDGRRKISVFYWPDAAKISRREYDEAEMIEAVRKMSRPVRDLRYSSSIGKVTKKKLTKSPSEGTIEISMKSIGNHKVIAYRLEVWGNDSRIYEKNWKLRGARVGKYWWRRL